MPISFDTTQNTTLFLPEINHQLSKLLKSEWFDIAYWRNQNAVTGSSQGRNITWFIGHKGDEWVLRHYYRGGLIEKLFKDKFFYTRARKSRCYQELELLEKMYLQGLPVPKPIAGRLVKKGFFYRADLLIEKIPDAKDLVALLSNTSLGESDWRRVGSLIGKFHEAGIYHSDLNAHNILIDQKENFWLIDFDKCEHRAIDSSWQNANLNRLLRSFNKEKNRLSQFAFAENNWQWLLAGYRQFYHKQPNLD